MELRKEIRKFLLEQDMSLSELAKKLGEIRGGGGSVQNLSTRLGRGSITFKELEIILEILGYSVDFKKL